MTITSKDTGHGVSYFAGMRKMMLPTCSRSADSEIHENLKKISDDLRKSVDRVQGKADHTGRNLFLLLTGVVIGVLFNPISGASTRKWLKDKIFGAEPEFSYQGNGPAASSASSSSSSSSGSSS